MLLLPVVVLRVVHIDKFNALLQGHTDTFAPQDQLDAHPVGGTVDSSLAFSRGADQALFFVKADGSGGDAEFPCQF